MSIYGDFLGLQLTVLQNNWKKAEDEVYRLDEFVERMRKVGVSVGSLGRPLLSPLLEKPFTIPEVYLTSVCQYRLVSLSLRRDIIITVWRLLGCYRHFTVIQI